MPTPTSSLRVISAGTLAAALMLHCRTTHAVAAGVRRYALDAARDTSRAARVASADSIALAAIAAKKAPGIAVVVLAGRDTLLARGYGLPDVTTKRAMPATAVFRAGSIAKTFTAAAVLRLVRDGKLRLEDSLHRFLPQLAAPARDATIHQLLTHTSGIASYTELPWFRARGRTPIARDEMLRLIAAEPLRFAHGARWSYNNSGYYLLGAVIERVAGESYAAYARRALVAPLHLQRTGYCDVAGGVSADVTGYDVENGAFDPVTPMDLTNAFAAGAMCASAGDLATWMSALVSGRVVPDSLTRRMLSPVALTDGSRAPYGYGLELTEISGHRRIGHGGSLPGFDGYAATYPADLLTIVVLANAGSANAEAIEKAMARALLGVASAAVAERPLAESALARYVGSYRAGPGRVVVSRRGARLHVAGPVDADLAYVGEHTFVMLEEPDVRLAFHVEGDSVTAIAWTSRGRTLTLPKAP
jgi:CubicO group peptidase (beta-lactamase class C family)